MNKVYQVTLFSTAGYRPVSCMVNIEQESDIDNSNNREERKKIQREGVVKICQKRYWSKQDLIKYGYTKCKIRAGAS